MLRMCCSTTELQPPRHPQRKSLVTYMMSLKLSQLHPVPSRPVPPQKICRWSKWSQQLLCTTNLGQAYLSVSRYLNLEPHSSPSEPNSTIAHLTQAAYRETFPARIVEILQGMKVRVRQFSVLQSKPGPLPTERLHAVKSLGKLVQAW